jgi:nicotinate-nucleotide--dimethylbenzimidazole phosphoribosyltransferase
VTQAHRTLVLGGIRSGKSEFAEGLLNTAAAVRYLATAREDPKDPSWTDRLTAHRARRPDHWDTVECGADPAALTAALAATEPGTAVLVDDLGGWLTTLLDTTRSWPPTRRTTTRAKATTADPAATGTGADPGGTAAGAAPADPVTDPDGPVQTAVRELADAVASCPAGTLVLVSPEVGLSVVPETPAGRLFADLLGTLNRTLATRCDATTLVVAGHPVWLTGNTTGVAAGPAGTSAAGPVAGVGATVSAGPVITAPVVAAGPTPELPADDDLIAIRPPDRVAINRAKERLAALAVGGAGLGELTEPVAWLVGATGGTRATDAVRVVLVGADHAGGASAGDRLGAELAGGVRDGSAPLARLADLAGATVRIVDAGLTEPVPGAVSEVASSNGSSGVTDEGAEDRMVPAGAVEVGDACTVAQVDRAIALGRRLAEEAADEGVSVLVPAACGAGVETAAAAALAASTGSEAATLLGRVIDAGRLDDAAWMARCVAARDALHRTRLRGRDARTVLAMLGGPDLAVLTGLLLGAAIRRTPVVVDNPAAAAAMVLARDLAPSSPWWCLLPDTGRHPALRLAADLLGLEQFLDLGLGLGDGTAALTAITALRPVMALAGTVPNLVDADEIDAEAVSAGA